MKKHIEKEELLRLFELAEDVAHIGYWEWNVSTNEVFWSPIKKEIYGEDREKFVPSFEKFLEVIDDETRDEVVREIESVLSGKKSFYDLQHKIRLKSGKVAWIHEKGFLIRDDNGNPVKMVGVVYDITDKVNMLKRLKSAEEKSTYLKSHDQLTSLHNKESLMVEIQRMILKGGRFSLVFLDIDNFKSINNTFGHRFGDDVIVKVGEILEKRVGGDRLYRYGADDFVILHDDTETDVSTIVSDIAGLFEKNIVVGGKSLMVTVSMGVCRYPDSADNAKDLLKNANSALVLAKGYGRGRVLYYESYMSDIITQKRSILDALSEAVENELFVVYYQPKVDSRRDTVVGFEALVRWINPDGNLVPPGLFLPIAQEYGLLSDIDYIVLKKALEDLKRWHEMGFKVSVSVNFNLSDFEDNSILSSLSDASLLPFVTIEITENELMACSDRDLELINRLKRLGLKISLDDFGTGYSSLRYIHKLPIDELKIDRAFVENIPGNSKDEALVTIIKSIVDTFGLGCVVEGVEREEQKEFFQRLGLTTIQGFFYGRPMDAADATKLLENGPLLKDRSDG